jgi:hypothetical protein
MHFTPICIPSNTGQECHVCGDRCCCRQVYPSDDAGAEPHAHMAPDGSVTHHMHQPPHPKCLGPDGQWGPCSSGGGSGPHQRMCWGGAGWVPCGGLPGASEDGTEIHAHMATDGSVTHHVHQFHYHPLQGATSGQNTKPWYPRPIPNGPSGRNELLGLPLPMPQRRRQPQKKEGYMKWILLVALLLLILGLVLA